MMVVSLAAAGGPPILPGPAPPPSAA